ncbi:MULTISPECIES: acyl carrier protein [unclassified Streptomyces]|uniref:acyl carrier protein n=1 Tax=unclassified Streptomyces TaxID=2593676 RepID=UPI002365A766|nr:MULTISPECIES: acyl carrier protein [unclassified Streptomyces]MDF3142281.1 acyl carrier protein [Streptomyces sp. T21Q-yed]WDF37860.1 acyl carrier protein [Streptomyces sp. T12]
MPLTHDNVVSILAEITGIDEDEITPQTTLLDVEMDSLLLVEFAVVLAERHQVDVADNLNLTPESTIADFVAVVAEQSSTAAAVPSVAVQ